MEKGKLYLCATPIGNLSDISERCLEILKMSDVVAAEDTRRTGMLLNHFEIKKPLISYFEHNKRERGAALLVRMKNGENMALVTDAGTPAISDPGEDLVRLCADNDVEVIAIPGACALISALIVSGLSTSRFCFEGFLSVNKKQRKEHLEHLIGETRTMIFYEAPHKLKNTLNDMYAHFGDRKITLCREITKLHEETVRTTLKQAVECAEEKASRGEYVLVLEGTPMASQSSVVQTADLAEMVNLYIEEGMDAKDAIKQTAVKLGVPKRAVYEKYHNLG